MVERVSRLVVPVGAIAVVVLAVLIALDLCGVFGEPRPPAWLGDWTPERHEVCVDFPETLDAILEADAAFVERGWEPLPSPIRVFCDREHAPAPDGVLRWHSCDTLRLVDGQLEPPCPSSSTEARNGYTWGRIRDGALVAADLYVQTDPASCTVAHEMGHGRGMLVVDGALRDAHTDLVGHLMLASCGTDWRWLDRRDGGDWPHGEER